MRKWLIVGLLILAVGIVGCAKEAEARGFKGDICDSPFGSIMNECVVHPYAEDRYEPFDYGVYLHLILFESEKKDWEIGVFNTYEVQRDEITSLIGGKIYFNRLFWQKEE